MCVVYFLLYLFFGWFFFILKPSAVNKNAILLKVNLLSWLFSSLDTEKESQKPNTDTPKPVSVDNIQHIDSYNIAMFL